MTGTLSGYLVYRLQDKIQDRTGNMIAYKDLIAALTESLNELTKDMSEKEFIELPNGSTLTINKI
jgi:hypothetical protein